MGLAVAVALGDDFIKWYIWQVDMLFIGSLRLSSRTLMEQFFCRFDTLTDMCGLWKIVAVGGVYRLTYLVPMPELDIEFIGLDTNFEWQCDIFKDWKLKTFRK